VIQPLPTALLLLGAALLAGAIWLWATRGPAILLGLANVWCA
jgi:hypothetical protein